MNRDRQLEQRKNAIRFIQRVIRGFLGRRIAHERAIELEKIRELRANRTSAYYILKEDYFKSQNILHRSYTIRIQCAFRCYIARRITYIKRREKNACVIQRCWKNYLVCKEAKLYVDQFRELKKLRNISAIHIQRIIRGFMGRYEFKKHEHVQILKWFATEIQSLGMVGQALQNFRVRKRTQERLHRQIVLLQALIRKFLQRCKFIRGYKRLVRERDNRKRKERIRACISIQGFARIIRAKKMALKRKLIVVEQEKQKKVSDE